MNKAKENRSGFTLIELVMVIVIVGILVAAALPRFIDLQTQAKVVAEDSVVGAIRTGISNYYAKEYAASEAAYPASLDSAMSGSCAANNVCFDMILSQGGITSDWTKRGNTYTGPNRGVYVYNNTDGSFSKSRATTVPVEVDLLEAE